MNEQRRVFDELAAAQAHYGTAISDSVDRLLAGLSQRPKPPEDTVRRRVVEVPPVVELEPA